MLEHSFNVAITVALQVAAKTVQINTLALFQHQA